MKKLLYFVSAGMLVASAACSNANKQEENDSMADSMFVDESLNSDSSGFATDNVNTTMAPTDTIATPDNNAKVEEKATEEAAQSKNSKQIDKLLKQCSNFISDIKREGYENGKPMDPADLQFSDVRTYIKDLRGAISKLSGLKNDMSDEQKTKFDDIQQKANKIFKEMDF